MTSISYQLSNNDFIRLQELYPNKGKNGDIAKIAVEIVKLYFKSINSNAVFKKAQVGGDILVSLDGVEIEYEIKGTEDNNLAFSKLKVSSLKSHDALVAGIELIRVTNIRKPNVILHFLKFGEDFTLHPEPRWSVKQVK
jgi:hypothetical protein